MPFLSTGCPPSRSETGTQQNEPRMTRCFAAPPPFPPEWFHIVILLSRVKAKKRAGAPARFLLYLLAFPLLPETLIGEATTL